MWIDNKGIPGIKKTLKKQKKKIQQRRNGQMGHMTAAFWKNEKCVVVW